MRSLQDIVAVSAVRTASGKFGGTLREIPVFQLGAAAIRGAFQRIHLDSKAADDCILGCCRHTGNGTNPARTAARYGGISRETPATTVTMACASGMRSVILGIQTLLCGDASFVITGGMESMSTMPYILPDFRWEGLHHGNKLLLDGWHDSRDPFVDNKPAGALIESLVKKHGISREEQDRFAWESHRKAREAGEEGLFREEIVPVSISRDSKPSFLFSEDETIRQDVSLEKLSQLNPVFQEDGMLTAGNSSCFADGAAILLLTTRGKAESLGLSPLFRVLSYAVGAVDNEEMGIGPSVALLQALEKAGMALSDLDLLEVNEAFAGMILVNERILRWDRNRVNRQGGALALGHPVGCSGARILVTLAYELKHFQREVGAAAVGGAGGVAAAMVIQRAS